MKITLHSNRGGLTWVGMLILFVLFLVFIGAIAFVLVKTARRVIPKHTPPEERAAIIQQMTTELRNQVVAKYPDAEVWTHEVEVFNVPAFIPFGPADRRQKVQASFDLQEWWDVAILEPGEQFADTNVFEGAFYRIVSIDDEPIYTTSDHHSPGFYSIPRE